MRTAWRLRNGVRCARMGREEWDFLLPAEEG
jgi:hypothetical protein